MFERIKALQYDDSHLLVLKDTVQRSGSKEVTIGDDAEFAYNNNYQSSIQMALYEALYGRRYLFVVGWFKPGEARLLGTDLVRDDLEKVKLIQDRHRTTQSRQKSYADRKIRDVAFIEGEKKYYKDPSHVLYFSSVQLDKDFTYDEESVAILDRQVWKLRSKDIAPVKV
ncbi:uncharacterized protein [Nicotiana tomentosiformis]|uniref:uncharacterized protein n=1 Tax=Nicotiana tomentosiformis TaxID=4098 RepID=UPI00388C3D3C